MTRLPSGLGCFFESGRFRRYGKIAFLAIGLEGVLREVSRSGVTLQEPRFEESGFAIAHYTARRLGALLAVSRRILFLTPPHAPLFPALQATLEQLGKIENLRARSHGFSFFRPGYSLYFALFGLLFHKLHDLILERVAVTPRDAMLSSTH